MPADETASWPELRTRIDDVRAAWQSATAELTGEERPPSPRNTGRADPKDADEEVWSAAQIHSHVANALLLYADVLSRVAVSREATFAPPQRVLPGHHPYPRIRDIGEKGWTDFRGAAVTVSKQPDRGAVITYHGEQLDARQFVARTLGHLQDHTEQIRALAGDDDPAAQRSTTA